MQSYKLYLVIIIFAFFVLTQGGTLALELSVYNVPRYCYTNSPRFSSFLIGKLVNASEAVRIFHIVPPCLSGTVRSCPSSPVLSKKGCPKKGCKNPALERVDFFGASVVQYGCRFFCTAHSLCGLPSFPIGVGEDGFF